MENYKKPVGLAVPWEEMGFLEPKRTWRQRGLAWRGTGWNNGQARGTIKK